jgi:hypothetical protein
MSSTAFLPEGGNAILRPMKKQQCLDNLSKCDILPVLIFVQWKAWLSGRKHLSKIGCRRESTVGSNPTPSATLLSSF